MREIVYTGQYKRDLKRARKRRMPEDDLNEVIRLLAEDKPLPAERRDHALTGEFSGLRECHIHPDWLLVYSKEDIISAEKESVEKELHILNLIRTGTHADLF
ncbi:type II toxin-antitoxin system mRNA interferase toxin, RelE/StbE family [Prevotella sp. oral taxon 376]|uniref:type II toxin-antitoxin system YafQ family toxin n=1 Tax=Prevotella sp. oral taxon 376 TaxID=712466 RepID=UPI000D1D6793|nr:type II toxin-antitoxin system YafQ family toxin [Prevotella sp. oral taxon 376]PTL33885.1 type II toxin-antitoxin system mRNA interferase toxin, RelE/StbE family [Prevotella sp. oral taxon 376]